jgi:hypothetical protein
MALRLDVLLPPNSRFKKLIGFLFSFDFTDAVSRVLAERRAVL